MLHLVNYLLFLQKSALPSTAISCQVQKFFTWHCQVEMIRKSLPSTAVDTSICQIYHVNNNQHYELSINNIENSNCPFTKIWISFQLIASLRRNRFYQHKETIFVKRVKPNTQTFSILKYNFGNFVLSNFCRNLNMKFI